MSKPVTAKDIIDGINVEPKFHNAYARVVAAGMKVLFSQQTHNLMLDKLTAPGAMSDKLASGVAGLVLILWNKSNSTIPPQILIPVAMNLLAQTIDFLAKSGNPVDGNDVGDAMQKLIGIIMDKFTQAQKQNGQNTAQQSATNGASAGGM